MAVARSVRSGPVAAGGGPGFVDSRAMSARWLLERRLSDSSQRLRRLRSELAVADEQLLVLGDAADEARLRALVSETPLAEREYRQARRHADAMNRHRARLAEAIAQLQRTQDELLDELAAGTG